MGEKRDNDTRPQGAEKAVSEELRGLGNAYEAVNREPWDGPCHVKQVCDKAADLIDQLTRERDEADKAANGWRTESFKQQEAREAAKAKVAGLRKCLEMAREEILQFSEKGDVETNEVLRQIDRALSSEDQSHD